MISKEENIKKKGKDKEKKEENFQQDKGVKIQGVLCFPKERKVFPSNHPINLVCFTCTKKVGRDWEAYQKLLKQGYNVDDAMDKLGYYRVCDRRMLSRHYDIPNLRINQGEVFM